MADDPLASRAAFAERFKNTTNLDQRRRFAQDISEAKAREEERAQADFERMQLQNPEVGRLVLAREKEDRAARNQLVARDLAERKFQWDMEKGSRLETLNAKRMDLQMRQEDRLLRDAEIKMERQDREESDTLAVQEGEQALRDSGAIPGSAAYKRGVIDLFLKHPNVKKEFRISALEGAEITQDQYQAAIDAIEAGASRASARLPGGGTATFTSPKEDKQKEVKIDTARLDRIKKERSKILAKDEKSRTEGDRDLLGYYDNEIAAIDKQRQAAAPKTQATQPTPTQAAPVDGMQSNLETPDAKIESLRVKPGTPIDKGKATEIMSLSGNDPKKARELAAKLGYVLQ